MPSLLSALRARTLVSCDTLSLATASSPTLGPFTDCTSNQAIAYFELLDPSHAALLTRAAALALSLTPTYPGTALPSLAVEIAMVLLARRCAPSLSGRAHVQTNPSDAYSAARTVAGARRIVRLFREVAEGDGAKPVSVCVKIPATWEGLLACEVLEGEGVCTLATTLFTMEQAARAGHVGCGYVAPYVNELRVHFDAGYKDPAPNLALCVDAQRYFERFGMRTAVLPASLTSVKECMALAGARYLTIAPALLQRLAETNCDDVEAEYPSLFTKEAEAAEVPDMRFVDDEERYRMAFTRNTGGANENKLTQAINIFCDMQLKLEEMLTPYCQAA